MKRPWVLADRYLKNLCWTDLALLKLCLAALGILLGLGIPRKGRGTAFAAASVVFIASYLPLMARFFRAVRQTGRE